MLGEVHDDFLSVCIAEATSLVDTFVDVAEVPSVVLERAYTEVAAELFNRRSAPHGQVQLATFADGMAARIPRDPMHGVYSMLRPWVGGGFA